MHVCSYMTNVKTTYFLFEFVFKISVINTILWNIYVESGQFNLRYIIQDVFCKQK